MIRVLVCWLFCSATVALAEAPSPAVTGFQTKDRSVTIDRCVKTSWSFSGCTAVFPQQARASLAASCADPKTEYRNVLCEHFARLQLRGVGGPVDRKAALATLSALCAQKDRVACADPALTFDAASGAVELREEASATAPAWTITGKLTR